MYKRSRKRAAGHDARKCFVRKCDLSPKKKTIIIM